MILLANLNKWKMIYRWGDKFSMKIIKLNSSKAMAHMIMHETWSIERKTSKKCVRWSCEANTIHDTDNKLHRGEFVINKTRMLYWWCEMRLMDEMNLFDVCITTRAWSGYTSIIEANSTYDKPHPANNGISII